jgi:hypothetical protein
MTIENKGSGFNGKYKRLPAIYREKLSKAMPPQAIKPHPTKTYLSTIKAIYIVERLNDVFGIMGWDFESDIISTTPIDNGKVVVVACGRLYFREFDLYTPIHYGGHDGKLIEAGDVHKSAITDALNKCASIAEIGIQVFKGAPNSQDANKSKRLDIAKDENPQGLAKPAHKPVERTQFHTKADSVEPVDEEREQLIKEYTEVFGKKPRSNMKTETLKSRVEEGKEKEKIVVDANPQSYMPINEPAKEEQPAELLSDFNDEDMNSIEVAISNYTDADALKREYKKIFLDAQVRGASGEQQDAIKKSIQEKFNQLSKLSENG